MNKLIDKLRSLTVVVGESQQGTIHSLCVVGKELWSGAADTICVWDATKTYQLTPHQSHRLKKEIQAHKGIISSLIVVENNESKFPMCNISVWSCSWDGTVRIWDTREHNDYTCIKILNQDVGKTTPFTCLYKTNNRVWAGTQRALYIWDLDGNRIGKIDIESDLPVITIVSAANQIWCGVDRDILTYPASISFPKPIKPIRILSGHTEKVQCLLYVNDAVWSGDAGGDIYIWSIDTFDCVTILKGAHNGAIFCMICPNPDRKEQEVWSSGKDHVIRIWDSENHICVKALKHTDHIFSMAAVPHDQTVWTGSHSLCVWNEEKMVTHNIRLLTYNNEDKYVGEVIIDNNDIQRHGRGELHCTSGEIYVGNWMNDKRNGYGIATYQNKDKYYGNWLNDQMWGHGVYVYNDGTAFEGMWKAGKRKGLGTILFPNGDRIEGEWKDDEIVKAKYYKGTTAKLPKCTQELFSVHSEVSLNETREKTTRIIPFHKWNYFSVTNVKEIEKVLKEKYPSMRISLKDLSILLNDETHPLGQGLADFSYMFNASYHYSYGQEKTLLFNAIDDVHSFIKGMELTIATLIPSIKQRDCVVLISNIVFSKIYHSLFALYKEVNKNKDSLLNVKLHSLSAITLKTIGIRDKFWLDAKDGVSTPSGELPYKNVINKLRQLSELKTISKKLRCLIDASKSILRCVDEFYQPHLRNDGEEKPIGEEDVEEPADEDDDDGMALGAGDKFPILLYCILKAKIPHLASELSFIKEFADPQIFREESQYRLIELEQAITYIQTLDWNVFDEEGVLTSVSYIQKRVVQALNTGRNLFFNKVKEFPRMLWLAEIFLMIGTRGEADHNKDFLLEEYQKYLSDPNYVELATGVLSVVGLELTKDDKGLKIHFVHTYPQYVYTQLSSVLEEEIQHLI